MKLLGALSILLLGGCASLGSKGDVPDGAFLVVVDSLVVEGAIWGVPGLCFPDAKEAPASLLRAANRSREVLPCSRVGADPNTYQLIDTASGRPLVWIYIESWKSSPASHTVTAGFTCGIECGKNFTFEVVRKDSRWVVSSKHMNFIS
jgi:hypothetical protein